MNLLMTATPLAMIACGHGFADSAFVIQWHVLGMFAPSFVTGHLIARLGVGRVMGAGLGLLVACVAIDLAGVSVAHFAAALLSWAWAGTSSSSAPPPCSRPATRTPRRRRCRASTTS
jgi:hypothetical protein